MAKQSLPSIDIVLDEVRRKLDFQFEQLDGLDTKASIVLGIAGVGLTIVVTYLYSVAFDEIICARLTKAALALIFVPLVLCIALSIAELWIKKYDRPPKLERLRSHYITESAEETKLKIIDISLKAIEDNANLLNRQIWLVRLSYISLSIGLGLLVYFWIWGLI